ncbi:MAG: hypothetical protein ACT4QG_09610 [Sporichthyaceae bacterium]
MRAKAFVEIVFIGAALAVGTGCGGNEVAAPAAPAATENVCEPAGGVRAGESATNPAPYDSSTTNVTIDEAKLAHKNSPNHITMEIKVLNNNKKPTCAAYPVFLSFHQTGLEEQEAPICQDEHFNSPDVPRGTYHCTAYIDGPGEWIFTATVNKPADVGAVQTQLHVESVALDFPDVPKLAGLSKGLKYVVEGSTFEVFLLQLHVALAGLWMLIAAMLAFLALPRLRRTLSVLALHTLEVRRGFLNSVLWGTFGGTVGTGMYLLATQTAYEAPFSTKKFSFSAYDKLTSLPYAQSYMLILYGKILIFGAMAVASVILMLEAGRVAQLAQDADPLEREDEDDLWGKNVHFDEEGHVLREDDLTVAGGAAGSVAQTAVRAQRRTSGAVGVSQQTLTTCALVLLVGALAIGGAVTGLKYLHELIETASAAAIIRSGG